MESKQRRRLIKSEKKEAGGERTKEVPELKTFAKKGQRVSPNQESTLLSKMQNKRPGDRWLKRVQDRHRQKECLEGKNTLV